MAIIKIPPLPPINPFSPLFLRCFTPLNYPLILLFFTENKTLNKTKSTEDRVFMAVVGPSICGKTELFFENIEWKRILTKI